MSHQPVVLITGANRGLGLATATRLLSLRDPSYHVIVGCRSGAVASRTASDLRSLPGTVGTVSAAEMDVTSDSSVDAAAAEVQAAFGRVDVLVNNAGVYGGPTDPATAGMAPPLPLRVGLRAALAANVVGAAAVTDAFAPLLLRALSSFSSAGGVSEIEVSQAGPAKSSSRPRVVFVSTGLASMTHSSDPTSGHFGPYATEYRASKAALNMLLVQYANHPAWNGIEVVGVDPGFLATDFSGSADAVRKLGAIEPDEGAKMVVEAIVGEGEWGSGKVTGAGGVVPW